MPTPAAIGWSKINNLRAQSSTLSGIAFDPSDPNRNTIYVTYSNFNAAAGDNHVYKTTNGGGSWVGIDGTGARLPDVPVHCLAVDPTNSQRLYIGTDIGVFVSLNGGRDWARENTGFANAITEALSIANHNGTVHLYAFTHGRGARRVSLGSSTCAPPIAPGNLTATAVSSSQINLQWQDNRTPSVSLA